MVDRLGELPNLPPSLGASREEENGDVMLKPFDKDGNHESGPDHERFLPKKPFCSMAFVLLDLWLNCLGSGTRHGEGLRAAGLLGEREAACTGCFCLIDSRSSSSSSSSKVSSGKASVVPSSAVLKKPPSLSIMAAFSVAGVLGDVKRVCSRPIETPMAVRASSPRISRDPGDSSSEEVAWSAIIELYCRSARARRLAGRDVALSIASHEYQGLRARDQAVYASSGCGNPLNSCPA